MYLEGLVPSDICDNKYLFTDYCDQPIDIIIDGKTTFTFLIQKVKFEQRNHVTKVIVKAASASILMDRKKHSRSFQDVSISYQSIFNAVGDPYSLSNVIACASASKSIQDIIIQYNETDWEFFKRMASHLNVFALPDPKGQKPQIYIDKRQTNTMSWDENEYSISHSLADKAAIMADCEEIFQLGQAISINGKIFYLKRTYLYIQNAQLKNHCVFVPEDGLLSDKIYNEEIVGADLIGTVLNVENTSIKIKLDIDSGWKAVGSNSHWFEYMSVYSSPEGNGWYFMPEIGDRAYLKVPSKKEGTSYTAGAVHVTDTERADPQIKFIKTRDGKVIRFTPSEIHIMVTPETYIKLYDKGGIDVVTDGDINFTAGKSISIQAQNEVDISGKKSVVIEKGKSKITITDTIKATGKRVKLI